MITDPPMIIMGARNSGVPHMVLIPKNVDIVALLLTVPFHANTAPLVTLPSLLHRFELRMF